MLIQRSVRKISSHNLCHMTQDFKFVSNSQNDTGASLSPAQESLLAKTVFIPHGVIDFHKERAVDLGHLFREDMQGEGNHVLNCQLNYQLFETSTVHSWIQYHAHQIVGLSVVFDLL